MPDAAYGRTLRRLALATPIATYILVVIGGIVRVTGSGLGCPDWPTCYGQVLPPPQIESIIEYSHRFTAGVVSLMVLSIAWIVWRSHRENRRVALPAFAAVGLLIVQIALGAITVWLELPPPIVAVHLGTALLLLACTLIVAINVYDTISNEMHASHKLARLSLAFTFAIMVVIVLGAWVTVGNAALACSDWPLCTGQVVPSLADPSVAIHFLHRFAVFATGALLVALVVEAWRVRKQSTRVWRIVSILLIVFIAQVGVGGLNVLLKLPIAIRGLHLALAALVWAISVVLTTVLLRSERAMDVQARSRDRIEMAKAS